MIGWLAENGGTLLLGSTTILAIGAVIVALTKEPLHRQRIGELSVLACLAFLALACVPFQRWSVDDVVASDRGRPTVTDGGRADQGDVGSPRRRPLDRLGGMNVPESLPEAGSDEALAAPHRVSRSPVAVMPTLERAPDRRRGVRPAAAVGPAKSSDDRAIQAFVWVFLAGAVASASWLAVGYATLRRTLRRTVVAPDRVTRLLAAMPDHLRPARLTVRMSPGAVRPFCAGIWRPVIVVPSQLVEADQAVITAVLRHELAHLSRGDLWTAWLFALARPWFWFHPLHWWLVRQVRFASEAIADEVAAGPEGRREYARRLISLAERDLTASAAPAASLALFRSKSEFFRRMEMLIARGESLKVRCSRRRRAAQTFAAALVVAVLAGFLGTTPLPAQETPGEIKKKIAELRAEKARLMAEINHLATHSAPDPEDPFRAPEAGKRDVVYRVRRGDSLAMIAKRFYGSATAYERIVRANPKMNPKALKVGEKLRIPNAVRRAGGGLEDPWGADVAVTPQEDPGGRRREDPRLGASERALPGVTDPRRGASNPRVRGTDDPTVLRGTGDPRRATPRRPNTGRLAGRASTSGPAPAGNIDMATFDLVTRAVDLRDEAQIQEIEVQRLSRLAKAKSVSEADLEKAMVRLQGARQKYSLARQLIKIEIDAAEQELDETQRLVKAGFVSKSRLRRLEVRLEILKSGL